MLVYTIFVRNITFSADEDLIERARLRAAEQKTSLNIAFRQWLERYAGSGSPDKEYRDLMQRMNEIDAGRKFSREEMNER